MNLSAITISYPNWNKISQKSSEMPKNHLKYPNDNSTHQISVEVGLKKFSDHIIIISRSQLFL